MVRNITKVHNTSSKAHKQASEVHNKSTEAVQYFSSNCRVSTCGGRAIQSCYSGKYRTICRDKACLVRHQKSQISQHSQKFHASHASPQSTQINVDVLRDAVSYLHNSSTSVEISVSTCPRRCRSFPRLLFLGLNLELQGILSNFACTKLS